MSRYEDSPPDDDYGSYIAGLMNDSHENTARELELERRWRESQATPDDVDSLLTSPVHVRKRPTTRPTLAPGLLDLDDDTAAEAPIAPIEDR